MNMKIQKLKSSSGAVFTEYVIVLAILTWILLAALPNLSEKARHRFFSNPNAPTKSLGPCGDILKGPNCL